VKEKKEKEEGAVQSNRQRSRTGREGSRGTVLGGER